MQESRNQIIANKKHLRSKSDEIRKDNENLITRLLAIDSFKKTETAALANNCRSVTYMYICSISDNLGY